MSHRVAILAVVFSLAAVAPVLAQTGAWTPPMTPWGDPDLQGQWNSQTSIPLERPLEGPLAGRESLTEEEAARLEAENRAAYDLPPREGSPGTYNAFWRDFGNPLARTSLIIDPPDGRIPPLTAEAEARIAAERAERATRGPSDSPDTYSDGRPHLPESIRLWMGDSRARWEGNTLVVETANFSPKTNWRGSRETLHLTEYYTRVADDTIDYRFTVNDPRTFTQLDRRRPVTGTARCGAAHRRRRGPSARRAVRRVLRGPPGCAAAVR